MEKLEKVINNYGSPMFCMSATHLMEIGFREAENITDEDDAVLYFKGTV